MQIVYRLFMPDPGQVVYRCWEDGDGFPQLYTANYVHRRRSWHRYINTTNGYEWNENGLRWFIYPRESVRWYIYMTALSLSWTRTDKDGAIKKIMAAVDLIGRLDDTLRQCANSA